MGQAIHVNGEAAMNVGTGIGGALQRLGVTTDGVDIDIEDHIEPVFTDTFGPRVPFDEQVFLQTANIHGLLVDYDLAILANLRTLPHGGVEGVQGQAGALMGANGFYFRLLILSPTDSDPYNFLTARVTNARRVKVGTVKSVYDMSFFAYGYTGATGATTGAVLYNKITT